MQRSGLSLRTLLLLLVLAAALYAAGLSIYLTLSVGRAAASLGEGAEAVVYQLEDLTHRDDALDRAVTEARRVLDGPAAPDPRALRLIRTLAAAGGTRSRAVTFAKVPGVMRVEAARTDERMSRLGDALTELAALAELGRRGAAREQLRATDSLHDLVGESLAASGDLARSDLLDRQRALRAATTQASRVALGWLAIGVLFIPLSFLIVRRRVVREPFVRAKFLTLISVVEVLATPHERSPKAVALVETFVAQAMAAAERVLRELGASVDDVEIASATHSGPAYFAISGSECSKLCGSRMMSFAMCPNRWSPTDANWFTSTFHRSLSGKQRAAAI